MSNNVLVSLIFYAIQGFDIFEIFSHKHNSQRDAILINTWFYKSTSFLPKRKTYFPNLQAG